MTVTCKVISGDGAIRQLILSEQSDDRDCSTEGRASKGRRVRCPGHPIQYMGFGYGEYVAQVLELAGLTRKVRMEEYEPWDLYRVSSAA
jgi:hypothetical protein